LAIRDARNNFSPAECHSATQQTISLRHTH
jgi:hypothetical protein